MSPGGSPASRTCGACRARGRNAGQALTPYTHTTAGSAAAIRSATRGAASGNEGAEQSHVGHDAAATSGPGRPQ